MRWINCSNNSLFNEYNHFKNKFFPLRASLIRPFAALSEVRGMHIQLHSGGLANERIKLVRNVA